MYELCVYIGINKIKAKDILCVLNKRKAKGILSRRNLNKNYLKL